MKPYKRRLIFIFIITTLLEYSHGCQIEGVTNWFLPATTSIQDVYRGNVFDRATTNIEGINSITYSEGLNNDDYFDISHSNSRLIIDTNSAYERYEHYETEESVSITIQFRCTEGSTNNLVFTISVIDTNNNAPDFEQPEGYVFNVAPPLPPGYELTGCFNDLTVRDIDLTTQRIEFAIEDNPYFEIEYSNEDSSTPKEFKATLRTISFIRTLPEPVTFTITATDVDQTSDPPLSTSTTLTIIGDSEFAFPEEPVFSEAFYFADYVDSQLVLSQQISLSSVFDNLVRFSLEGDYSDNFEVIPDNEHNNIQIVQRVEAPLPPEALLEKQFLLVIRAEREYTSGDTATIIVELPEVIPLEFERAYYKGTIENNVLQDFQLVLSQGFSDSIVTAEVISEYESFFRTTVDGNVISLFMTPLTETIIHENSFINIEVVASTARSSATAVATLEIIKDDHVTPVFNRPIYSGSYNPDTGLTLEDILLVQGNDDNVVISLDTEHENLFSYTKNGPTITLTTSGIPSELFSEQQLVLTVMASKERTVGANAAVIIDLPAARELLFEASSYRGMLDENVLTHEPILFSTGYDETVTVDVIGDHENYFTATVEQNRVTIVMSPEIPENIITENDVLILTLSASGPDTVTAITTILIEIIKDDFTTPVFSRNVYYGTYTGSSIDIESISLVQGFGNDVSFDFNGDQTLYDYFEITGAENNNIQLVLRSEIPEDLIFNQKVFSFSIIAHKTRTVGANAAILIRFPTELTEPTILGFEQNTYTGRIENNVLTTDNIILSSGFAPGTQFEHFGDYSEHLQLGGTGDTVSLSVIDTFPVDEIDSPFIVIEIEARRERAVSVRTSLVINIVKQEVPAPMFTQVFYQGIYTTDSMLQFDDEISLIAGYNNDVEFDLEGEHASLFKLTEIQPNSFSIIAETPIQQEILDQNTQLLFVVVAHKPGTTSARSTIAVAIEKENNEQATLAFDRVNYLGTIENDVATLQPITLIEGYNNDVTFGLYGDLREYFSYTPVGPVVTVALQTAIPEHLIPANRIIVLEIRASSPPALATYATIVFEVISDEDVSLAVQLQFDAAYYTGTYGGTPSLVMDSPMTLSEGYDANVDFDLEGEHSEWFGLSIDQNVVTLVLTNGIPGAVLTNNRQLVFAIVAQRTGTSSTARAAIVISLTDEYSEDAANLGFDRVNYLGTIENDVATLQPITLIEGYNNDVTFGLYGDLREYFSYTPVGPVVTVALQTAIPEHLIPANRIIVLEIRASSPPALATYATIVFEVISDEGVSPAVQLQFDAAYYTGTYGGTPSLVMDSPMTLSEGYDANVDFDLEGEHSEWFGLSIDQNVVTLVLTNGIPGAVLTNNRQLVFAIVAQRTGTSSTARAAIVISLTDEYSEDAANLGFDRVNYLGTIENDVATLQPITLIEGYNNDVTFGLYGDLREYFSYTPVGPVVTVALQTAIPEHLIPANRIIVLEIRASSPPALATYATIVFEVISDEDVSPAVQLQFDAAYYTGTYGGTPSLVMDSPMTLSEGYDANVDFDLEGEHSEWFGLSIDQNVVTLVLTNGIPGAVLTNNRQLVFAIVAQRTGTSSTARAAIVISLTDEYSEDAANLGFDRVNYLGTIENDVATLQPITLIEGYNNDVTFGLYGDLREYFSYTVVEPVVTVALQTAIPEHLIPANRIIVLEIRASSPPALATYATIVFEVISDDDVSPAVQLQFDAAYYTGTYGGTPSLVMDSPMTLSEGYDANVDFDLEGEHSEWFGLSIDQNVVTLVLTNGIPGAVLTNNRQLVFAIVAQRTGTSSTARAAIVISLTDEYSEDAANLGFDRVNYLGTIENDVATLQPITLIEGYNNDVTFGLYGDLREYFSYTVVGPVVTVALQTAIPEHLIPANRIIVLEIRASSPPALATYATIVFEVISDDDVSPAVQLQFDAAYYTGTYGGTPSLVMDSPMTLSEGYDANVDFDLEGEHSEWFGLSIDQNVVTLVLTNGIPGAVLTNNRQLVFAIVAQRTGTSSTARAAIVISLTDEYSEDAANLGFDRVNYLGTIENDVATLQPITLIEGYNNDVTFGLYGDLREYFSYTVVGPVVTVALQTAIPEHLIPANRIIVLEIRASSPPALATYASIVFEVISDDDVSPAVQLQFDAAYYTGTYGGTPSLVMDSPMTLSEGYDANVDFDLEGEHSEWFGLSIDQNVVTLVLTNGIPGAVLTNNRQLVFAIVAQRTGTSSTARAAIVISLTDEYSEDAANLGFDRVNYLGTIENDVATLQPITLIEGYNNDVTFGLYGDLREYFSYTPVGSVVTVTLQTAIPEHLIPANRIIVLEIRASSPPALATYATIVFEVISDEDVSPAVQLQFDAAYYTGTYGGTPSLVMDSPMTLSEGYDANVDFDLEGEHSEWFGLSIDQNVVTLVLTNGIPGAVLTNNRQLVFAIVAQRTGTSSTARAAIVISLTDEYSEDAANLGFDRVNYLGTIENDVATLQPITLIEGYNNDVTFGLYGDLCEYFSYTPVGPVVTVALQTAIPEHLIPANRIIVLEIRASSPPALATYATIVFEVISDEDVSPAVQLQFDAAYYTGTYGGTPSLVMDSPMTLSEGYDANVDFDLEGEHSEWFGLSIDQNVVTLVLTNGIPGAVLTNNRQLVFAIVAQRTGTSSTARAAIVISLTDEYSEDAANLGFDRVNYLGTIENDVATLQPITLIEGYNNDVTFGLYGDLREYFSYTPVGSVVTVTLQTAIPEHLIPANRIIVLEIRASSPPALATYATIVFEVISDEDVSPAVQLQFDAAYYTGTYGGTPSLVMDSPMTLSEGYDANVDFDLEGEHSEWFGLSIDQNVVTLVLTNGIPGAVLTNNRQLVFAIVAQRTGTSSTARAAIVISLTDEYSEDAANLGFDRVNYLGTIENDVATLQPITLIEGYNNDVTFGLYGDLREYFSYTPVGSVVTVTLQTAIPEHLIPANRIIVLEIRASSPPALATYATIVFEVISDEDVSPAVQLQFDAAYYTGTYGGTPSLVMDSPMTLSEGYDANVDFDLEGEHSEWFGLSIDQNVVTLVLTNGIPGAVLTNNRQLVFAIVAQRTGTSSTARAAIVISLTDEYSEDAANLGFDRVNYLGTIENDVATLQPITLIEGYNNDVTFGLYGDLREYFSYTPVGSVVTVTLQTAIPEHLIPANRIIVLEIRASSPPALATYATIVFEVISDEDVSPAVQLQFDAAYYTGTYGGTPSLVMDSPMTLSEGYDANVDFDLEGEHSEWFGLSIDQNVVTLVLTNGIPGAVLTNNRQLVFAIVAQRTGTSSTARAAIVISLTDEYSEDAANLGFDRVNYLGTIENDVATLQPITLIEGYNNDVTFGLYGDLREYFSYTPVGPVVTVALQTAIPEHLIPANRIIVLEIRASSPPALATYATIVFEVISDEDVSPAVQLQFDAAYYTGTYGGTPSLVMDSPMTLSEGYDANVDFDLEGEHSEWFGLSIDQNVVTLVLTNGIPGAVLTNNRQLVFAIVAQRTGTSSTARAAIVISLTDEYSEDAANLGFDRVNYLGTIENDVATLQPITLIEGYNNDVTFGLYGDLRGYFSYTPVGPVVTVALQTAIPQHLIPANRIIVLEIRASSPPALATYATIVFEVISDEDVSPAVQLQFDAAYYTGTYGGTPSLVMDSPMTLSEGYDANVDFDLEGEHSEWFGLSIDQNVVTLVLTNGIPGAVLTNNRQLVFAIVAQRTGTSSTARAAIVISLTDDLQVGNDVMFERVLYEGVVQLDTVVHELILISGFSGASVQVIGDYSSNFEASVGDGVVTVQATTTLTLPSDVTSIALELHADTARAVLLLSIVQEGTPIIPTVVFSSQSYTVNVEITQTGLIGRVLATADNGEAITYSLAIGESHLQTRLSINNEGELYLSAPANSGVYSFQVIATTVITQATATATVHLTVEAVTSCGEDNIVVPPLIILDRDEEEAHNNLVVLDGAQYEGCQFTLTNRWPIDQTWLYVDTTGLHTTPIDREHESIAFMALSQIQVELILTCESDNVLRTKRSLRTDWLGPYDYGNNKWVLTETIPYNSRRSLVNLIVNDINDNSPIFVGKENEPIVVGYPTVELEERILPRSLVELQATDADIGENAALSYWSSESVLAVAASTGSVHVRDGAQLQDNQLLVVSATDQNGQGLTGSLQLMVKLLDLDNIAVVTVRNAFLDNEAAILTQLSNAIGYELKSLRSVVIPDVSDDGDAVSRKHKNTDASGVSLQLYAYGIINREPVTVTRLAEDINNSAALISVVSTVSLEDYLEAGQISVFERDTGLFVATIVLSVILFGVLSAIAVWFFLKWRKNNYNRFNDAQSLASRNESLGEIPKPADIPKPRLNVDELMKSERRLKEMLETPIEEVTVEPSPPPKEVPVESILDLSVPEPYIVMPIVIQSIDKLKDADDDDDEDEFGERKAVRRKSVVTFNENVEKIIHVEDVPDDNSNSEYEVYKF